MSRGNNETSDNKLDYFDEYVAQFKTWDDEIVFKGFAEVAISKAKNKLKYRRRFIAVTKYRFLIFKKNALTHRTTIDKDYHLLELKELGRTGERGVVIIYFHPDVAIYVKDNRTGLLIKMIRTSYRQFTFGWTEKYAFKLSIPEDECEELDTHFDPGPCHGFKYTYLAFCNQRRVPPREDFIRYIEDLHHQNQQELDLTNCPGIDSKTEISIDLIPVCCALQHNTFFHSFVIKDIINKDALQGLAYVLRTSTQLTKVVLRNTAAACPLELGEFLDANSENQIQVLDLSGNHFTTNAIVAFAKSLRLFNHRLTVLSLANCSIPSRGFIALMLAFKANYGMSLAIEELDISNNRLDTEASTAVCGWFNSVKAYSALRRLGVANTMIDIGSLLSHIKTMKQLEWIDISDNKCDKEAGEHLVELASQNHTLKVIRAANCNLPSDITGRFITALLKNELLSELCVDISGNDLSGKGVNDLVNALRSGNNIKVLNLSRTGLKSKGAAEVVATLPSSLMQLILDDCCSSTDSTKLVAALVELTTKNSNLKTLSIVGGEKSNRMYNKLAPFFASLKNNKTLTELDISSNGIGDAAFTTLCAALRENTTLTSLKCDRNKITIAGYQALRQTLNYNKTLCYIDYPHNDLDRASSVERDRFRDLISKILRILSKNGEPIILPNPFVFGQDWPIPSIPAAPLVAVPDTLKQDIPNFDLTYEKSENDVRLESVTSPPTTSPSVDSTLSTLISINLDKSPPTSTEIQSQPPPPLGNNVPQNQTPQGTYILVSEKQLVVNNNNNNNTLRKEEEQKVSASPQSNATSPRSQHRHRKHVKEVSETPEAPPPIDRNTLKKGLK